MRNFRDYEIWNIGMDLVEAVYLLSGQLPDTEKFGLQSQIRRSTVSIPSNIAEGCGRASDKEFARFLEIALGSAFELETQLIIGQRLGYFPENELENVLELLNKF